MANRILLAHIVSLCGLNFIHGGFFLPIILLWRYSFLGSIASRWITEAPYSGTWGVEGLSTVRQNLLTSMDLYTAKTCRVTPINDINIIQKM